MLKEKDFMLFGLKPEQSTPRGILLFLGIFLGATLFAAIFTPAVFAALKDFWPNKRVDVFFDRLRWIPIIIGIPWMIKICGLANISNIGLALNKTNAGHFIKFFAAGIAVAALVFAAQWCLADVSYAPMAIKSVPKLLLTILFSWLLGSFVIALLEETVFRALIFRCAYTAWGAIGAVIFTSAFFAYTHFKVPSEIFKTMEGGGFETQWYTGFVVAWYNLVGIFMKWDAVMFFALLMFGAVLSMIYVRTKVLWGPIGFHMGAVLAMFIYRKNFDLNLTPEESLWLGGVNPSRGILSIILLGAMLAVLCLLQLKKNSSKKS